MKHSTEFVLADYLDKLEKGEITLQECLSERPELAPLLQVANQIQNTPSISPRPAFRKTARKQLLAQLPARPKQSWLQKLFGQPLNTRPLRVSYAAISMILVASFLLLGGVGTVYASDNAKPGDALYGLDRSIEDIRIALADDNQQVAQLQMDFASERLAEAETLAITGDSENLQIAMADYNTAILNISETVASANAAEMATLSTLLDAGFSAHEAQFARIYNAQGEEGADAEMYCTGNDPHPVGASLAETYNTPYEDIMGWFCAGYGFGEISLALQTSEEVGVTTEELLAQKAELGGWGLVWQSLGLIGKPADAGPPENAGPPDDKGKPDDAGPPDDTGKPDDAGPPDDTGKPDDAGPPDDTGKPDDAGPPDDTGKPDDAGPPDDKGKPDDAGPPDDKGKPDDAGPPDDTGKPDDAGPPDDKGKPDDKDKPDNKKP